mgnify:FL=1
MVTMAERPRRLLVIAVAGVLLALLILFYYLRIRVVVGGL